MRIIPSGKDESFLSSLSSFKDRYYRQLIKNAECPCECPCESSPKKKHRKENKKWPYGTDFQKWGDGDDGIDESTSSIWKRKKDEVFHLINELKDNPDKENSILRANAFFQSLLKSIEDGDLTASIVLKSLLPSLNLSSETKDKIFSMIHIPRQPKENHTFTSSNDSLETESNDKKQKIKKDEYFKEMERTIESSKDKTIQKNSKFINVALLSDDEKEKLIEYWTYAGYPREWAEALTKQF